MTILGIDIGGSGVKGAPVDPATGELLAERFRVPTPQPADVDSVAAAVAEVAARFGGFDRVGVTFPGVVVDGVTRSAANVDKSWLDAPAAQIFAQRLGLPVTVLNDADAAGVAEVAFGAGRDQSGLVMMLTFGTGIGSALFSDGILIPNTEFGHVEIDGADAELLASDRIREAEGLSWEQWAARVERYLHHVEMLLSPRLIIVGGGVSKKSEKFLPLIDIKTPIVPATLLNNAGLIGAAMAAHQAAAGPGGQHPGAIPVNAAAAF
ncbi:polyphosphate glucokinase [Actinoplanes campanulatus]|uniref:Polyphosphate glucokinase n=1 Tax=Actinoplanes campanulatus TaxID=113559 RepID=A0A7W5FIL5_9ACTN|nr:ROK family protein [Actinoplanes campanulatus]MBB3099595.1 polyphosphate glucokinase [Actinoplanes campanulatus]GGN42072.1 polyphosphate glucokinase [Actinoplanes campanulatus]GID39946.1 polyphosphate glucokinase [Actinoplanes campanulatus]